MAVPFTDHLALLTTLLDRRAAIVSAIERQTLNVQGKDTTHRRDRAYFEQIFNSAIVGAAGLPRHMAVLPGTLIAAHLDDGFRPVLRERQAHALDPLELVMRAYEFWNTTRWPGRNGRTTFAQVVFAAWLLGQLELLTLRVWDGGNESSGERLRDIQRLLDRLNSEQSACVFVRDARWLIQTAQGPLTSELAPYFRVAERLATLDASYRLEIHRAGAVLAGGHLRSQQRYRALESGRAANDPEVLAITRNSNSMDAALLVWDLVALLEAYQSAIDDGDEHARRRLADAILQGLSADPELFLTRLDLLDAATTIEDVFIDTGGGHTSAGERHGAMVVRYREAIGRLRGALASDGRQLDPGGRSYSPLGISYGFCADMLWNVALGVLTSQSASDLALEDLFDSQSRLDEKAARAALWEGLPIRAGETEHFTHSQEWAQQVFQQVLDRLERQHDHGRPRRAGRLILVTEGAPPSDSADIPADAIRAPEHLVTSDVQRALRSGATAFPRSHVLADRKEGRYLASVEVDGKWFAVSKVVLTTCLAQDRDAVILGVPPALIERLRLTCPDLTVTPTHSATVTP